MIWDDAGDKLLQIKGSDQQYAMFGADKHKYQIDAPMAKPFCQEALT